MVVYRSRAVLQRLEPSADGVVGRSGHLRPRVARGADDRLGRRRGTDDGRSGGTEVLQPERRRAAAASERHDRRVAAAETQPGNIVVVVVVGFDVVADSWLPQLTGTSINSRGVAAW